MQGCHRTGGNDFIADEDGVNPLRALARQVSHSCEPAVRIG
jgi:hypothetical protein